MTETRIVPLELLQDLRDLASDTVEHHRPFASCKNERQERMDKVIRAVDKLLAQPAKQPGAAQVSESARKVFICRVCEGVYADSPVSSCDCNDSADFAEGRIVMLAAAPQAEQDNLDQRMKDAGMLSVAEILSGAPLDSFVKHAGVKDLETFAEWLEMRRAECLKLVARYDLGERKKDDDFYEWAIAHSAVFSEVHVNFKAARTPQAEQPGGDS